MSRLTKAFSLLEILTVLLIVAIFIALALPKFGTMKERTLDKEARANLRLIQTAEKIYRMEEGCYYPTGAVADTVGVNSFLKLFLPASGNANWNYSIPDTGGGNNFTARATRQGASAGWNRDYRIDKDDSSSCCCPSGGDGTQCPTTDMCAVCP